MLEIKTVRTPGTYESVRVKPEQARQFFVRPHRSKFSKRRANPVDVSFRDDTYRERVRPRSLFLRANRFACSENNP